MKTRLAVGAFVAMVAASTFGGKCYWRPDAATGSTEASPANFLDAANWEGGVAPKATGGDTVYLTNVVENAWINIPQDVKLNNLMVGGRADAKSFHLTGGKITTGGSVRIDHEFVSDNDFELTDRNASITPGHNMSAGDGTVFNGDFTFNYDLGCEWVYFGGRNKVTFNGSITGLKTQLRQAVAAGSGTMTFNGPVQVKKLSFGDQYGTMTCQFKFCATGNAWEACDLCYASIAFGCDNAMCASVPLSWHESKGQSASLHLSSYYLNGCNQVATGVESATLGSVECFNVVTGDNEPANLLLVGDRDYECSARTHGPLTVIWAPTGDFTQTFLRRQHLTTGRLVVSNGTLRVGGGAKFASVPTIEVAGGRFLVDSTAAQSLAAVQKVEIAAHATFEIGEGANPFASGTATVSLDEEGVFKIPAGGEVTLAGMKVDGVRLEAGDYTGEGGATGTVLDQISGTGVVHVLGLTPVTGVTKVWKGGSGKWSEPSNWQGGEVPVEGDKVELTAGAAAGAEIENDIPGLSLETVRFAGSKPLRVFGEGVTLFGSTAFENGVPNGVWMTNALDMALTAGDHIFKQPSGYRCVFSGVISGKGRLLTTNAGLWHFTGANTYEGGTSLDGGEFHLFTATAFGAGRTIAAKGATIVPEVSDCTYAYDLDILANDVCLRSISADKCHFGSVTNRGTGWFQPQLREGAARDLYIDGPVSAPRGGLDAIHNGTGRSVHFMDRVSVSQLRTDTSGSQFGAGWFVFHAPSELGTATIGWSAIRCEAVNALGGETRLVFSGYTGGSTDANGGRFDLNGLDQNVQYLETTGSWRPNSYLGRRICSECPATLTVRGRKSAVCDASIDLCASIVYDAADASYVQSFTNRANTTSGSLVASNGTIRILEGSSFANLTRLAAGPTGAIDVRTSVVGAFHSLQTVELAAGGKVLFADVAAGIFPVTEDCVVDLVIEKGSELRIPEGMTWSIRSLTYDGEPQDGGKGYGRDAIPEITGGGTVFVRVTEKPMIEATWTGGAGEAATGAELESNWSDAEAASALAENRVLATFASGGTEAVFPSGSALKGMIFDGPAANDFAVRSANGSAIRIYEEGITQGAALTNEISAPLAFVRKQTLTVGAGSSLGLHGALTQPDGAVAVEKEGTGRLNLYGENEFAAGLSVLHGALYVYGSTNALGKASAEDADNAIFVKQNGNRASLHVAASGVIERPICVEVPNESGGLYVEKGVTNVFTRKVKSTGGSPRYWFGDKTLTVFEGGFTSSGWFCPVSGGSSDVVFRKTPCNFNYFVLDNGLTLRLQASGNDASYIDFYGNGKVELEADGVFNGEPHLYFGHHPTIPLTTAYIDLHGHDCAFGDIKGCYGGAMKTTDGPATFTFTQTSLCTNGLVAFTGPLSIVKRGAGTFVQTRAIEATGTLRVAEGTFAFGVGGKCRACAGVEIDEGAALEVADGVNLRVKTLTVAGQELGAGTYWGADSANVPKAPGVTGKGSVTISGGILLIVR